MWSDQCKSDANMKVAFHILKRVYDNLQNAGENGTQKEDVSIHPDSHLFFVNAFEMPAWHWSQEKGAFEQWARRLNTAIWLLNCWIKRLSIIITAWLRWIASYGDEEQVQCHKTDDIKKWTFYTFNLTDKRQRTPLDCESVLQLSIIMWSEHAKDQIYEAAIGTRWPAILALRHACPHKRGKYMSWRSRWLCWAWFLTTCGHRSKNHHSLFP